MTVQDAYQACYDQIAREHVEYARANNGGNPFIEPALVETLEQATVEIVRRYVTPGTWILDAGCGPGTLLARLTDYQRDGCDMSDDYIDYAEELLNADADCEDTPVIVKLRLEHLGYPDNIFDAVICTDVLEHVLDEHAVLRELTRVLKPGGYLIIRVPDSEDMNAYWRNDEAVYEYVHLRRFDTPTLGLLLERVHGLDVVFTGPITYPDKGEPSWRELHAVAVKP